jgi:hypothetical protein
MRMRVDHPHLWGVLHRLHLSHDADPSKLEEWRRAPEGSQQEIWAAQIEAMGAALSAVSAEKTHRASSGTADTSQHRPNYYEGRSRSRFMRDALGPVFGDAPDED